MLDLADPALLRPCFERVEHLLAEPPLRQAFGRLGGRTLIAWDGTEDFRSQKLGCPYCLTRQRANGRIENTSRFVKFHWKPIKGVKSLVWDEAQKISGKDPDFHRRDLLRRSSGATTRSGNWGCRSWRRRMSSNSTSTSSIPPT